MTVVIVLGMMLWLSKGDRGVRLPGSRPLPVLTIANKWADSKASELHCGYLLHHSDSPRGRSIQDRTSGVSKQR